MNLQINANCNQSTEVDRSAFISSHQSANGTHSPPFRGSCQLERIDTGFAIHNSSSTKLVRQLHNSAQRALESLNFEYIPRICSNLFSSLNWLLHKSYGEYSCFA